MDSFGGWADDEDVADPQFLPPDSVEGPDKSGIKTYTSYRIVDGEKQKVVRKVKVVTKKVLVAKSIAARRQWKKFGLAREAGPGPEEETTIVSRDEVRLENPGDEAKEAQKQQDEMLRRLRESRANRAFKNLMEEKKAEALGAIGGTMGDAEPSVMRPSADGQPRGLRTGTALSEAAAAGVVGEGPVGGKYVPVHMRPGAQGAGAGGRFGEEESNSLRVTNISEDTTEDDLRELFSPFGRVQRVYLAKDRDTQISRGFAYISFFSREHAQKAMDKLNGFGYDHLILKVEWAKPSVKDGGEGGGGARPDTGGGNGMKYASGYGGALPQGLAK